jgi:endonuclease III
MTLCAQCQWHAVAAARRLRAAAAAATLDARPRAMNPAKRQAIFERLAAATPHPTTELVYAEYIKRIGLYRTKAKNVIATCRLLIERHGGEVPAVREALEALPGVGRKTANVILNTAFGQPTIAVDTHIFRVANRTGLAPGKDVRAVEDKLLKLVPDQYRQNAHHWLILHGRYVCKARKPGCPVCVIRDLCEFRGKTKA